jgi:hypothetical protein
MRAGAVVVADVLSDDALEVPIVEHQDVVETFATQGTEEAFADSVHVRRAHRCADDPDAGGAGERIEGGPELVVAIANRIRNRGAAPKGVALRSCCVTHACDGKRVVAACMTLRVASSMNTNAKIGRKNTSYACRKSHAQIWRPWFRRNVDP